MTSWSRPWILPDGNCDPYTALFTVGVVLKINAIVSDILCFHTRSVYSLRALILDLTPPHTVRVVVNQIKIIGIFLVT
jgi:hypothetical protein